MKRALRMIAGVLCLCLIFPGCSSQRIVPSITDDEITSTGITSEDQTEEETEYPTVPHVTTWDEINAIPVATPDMTEEELRQICVDFAVLQQSFQWTPTDDLDYLSPSASTGEDGKLHCPAGAVYGGLPYGSGGLSLYSAMEYYDETTGVLDTTTLTGKSIMSLSNHCSSSIRWGFGRVSTTVKYSLTNDMVRANGCIPLGPYTYNESISTFAELPTKTICQDNGEQTMYQSYALLNKADGVVTYGKEYGGHTRMIIEKATVVYNADGTIDGENSYVYSVEQFHTQTNTDVNEITVAQHGAPRRQYTFKQMFSSGYLPFSIPELCGEAEVQRAWAKLDTDEAPTNFETLQNASVISNYMIAKVTLTLFDENGTEISRSNRNVPNNPAFSYSLSTLLSARAQESTKKAGRILIQAFVASGENLTVFDGKVA